MKDARECFNCGDRVHALSSRDWCDGCEETAEQQVLAKAESSGIPADRLGETVLLRDYNLEIAELLEATEGHADPTVRSVRKLVIQSVVALKAVTDAAGTVTRSPHSVTPQPLAATPEAGDRPLTQGERMAALGTTAQQVRRWALENHVHVSRAGRLSNEALDAFERAQDRGAA